MVAPGPFCGPGAGGYGALPMVMVMVLVYVPAKTSAGTTSEKVGLTVKSPIPVSAAVLKNFTAVGGVAAAGTVTGVRMVFTAGVQPARRLSQDALVSVMVVASVGSVLPAPALNWVEVICRFQPAPEPRKS